MKHIVKYLFIVCVGLFVGCAQQSSPSGGAKDTEPPKIVLSQPQNFSLNYSGNAIELKFDEFVQINNLKEQLVITPSLKFPPVILLNGKKLKITFIDSLKPNTTYQFNFGDGIKDITENNPLDSNLFIFSTGNYIDSLFISGQVKDAFKLVPVADATVMLYEKDLDSIPFKERPTYFTKTNNFGFFEIKYLPKNDFKLVVIKDENKNFLFDAFSESVGFLDNNISSFDSLHPIIYLFEEDADNQYIKSVSTEKYGKAVFVFNQPTSHPEVELVGKSFKKPWYIPELNKTKDTLTYWITESIDTVEFVVSDNGKIIDTVTVILAPKPNDKKWNTTQLGVGLNVKKTGNVELYDSLFFVGRNPISGYQQNKIILIENNKDTIPVKINSFDQSMRKFFFKNQWKEDASYSLTILPNTFVDIFGLKNDTITADFITPTWNKYAEVDLTIEFENNSENCLVHFLDAEQNIIQKNQIKGNAIITYKNLFPGKYQVRLIYDQNKNGKWDTGNLLLKKQPEKVIYYAENIEVRSGWDIDLIWKIKK